jgi:trans-aconitate methyltransferase
MSANRILKIDEIKKHFENSNPALQRGNLSEYDALLYALYIAKKIGVKQGRALDVGCGDGLIMKELGRILPNLKIDGLELAETLSSIASIHNPNSNIYNKNAMSDLNTNNKYDVIYTFSAAQYFSPTHFIELNLNLSKYLTNNHNSKIVHMSIPNWDLINANYYVEYLKKNSFWKFPFSIIRNSLNFNRKYGLDGSNYHAPKQIVKGLSQYFNVVIDLNSDSYYRFDVALHKKYL